MTNKHYEAIHKYDFLTKELLQEEYISNGLTDKQIAKKYDISSKTIPWKRRKKFGIENRFKNKSNQNARVNRKISIEKEDAEQFLKEGMTFKQIAEKMGCSIIVAKRRFKELGLCKEQVQTTHYKYYNIEINNSQKQMLIGSLLGDGTITESGAYSCSHSIKQKEYFDHKMTVLNNLHSNKFQKYSHLAENTNLANDTESLHFTTGCNKYLYELRDIYYPDGIKVFPYEYLKANLEAEGLSYWYCDDGGKRGTKSPLAYLYTYGYSYEENKNMKRLFMEKFDIKIKIEMSKEERRGDKKYYLGMDRENTDKFFDIIEPFIVPIMRYKIREKK